MGPADGSVTGHLKTLRPQLRSSVRNPGPLDGMVNQVLSVRL